MAHKKYFLFTFVFCVLQCIAEELPSFIHVCHKEDPNLEQCLIASVEDLRPYLIDGVPEYKIPSLEPLVMHEFFTEDAGGMKISVSNVSAYGCSDFFVRGLTVNMDTQEYLLELDFPKLRIEAHYSTDGKLLMVTVRGGGNLEANITDIESRSQLLGELYEKDGETYLRYTNISIQVHMGGGKVRLENMFNGDKVLLSMINDVVNKNFDVFVEQLMPIIKKSLAAVILEIANDVVGPFTYKQLFPH